VRRRNAALLKHLRRNTPYVDVKQPADLPAILGERIGAASGKGFVGIVCFILYLSGFLSL